MLNIRPRDNRLTWIHRPRWLHPCLLPPVFVRTDRWEKCMMIYDTPHHTCTMHSNNRLHYTHKKTHWKYHTIYREIVHVMFQHNSSPVPAPLTHAAEEPCPGAGKCRSGLCESALRGRWLLLEYQKSAAQHNTKLVVEEKLLKMTCMRSTSNMAMKIQKRSTEESRRTLLLWTHSIIPSQWCPANI